MKTDYTPASVLLDYCKLFGLYFFCDPTEVSDDPDIYPKGVIHIMDRDTFYTDQVVNINELIDRSKPININPRTAESKWYSFSYQDAEGDAEEKYKNNLNRYSIGIELAGMGTQEEMSLYLTEKQYKALKPEWIGYTEEQYEALAGLVADICNRHEIPLDRDHVIGHDEFSPKKNDPGDLFDWSRIIPGL